MALKKIYGEPAPSLGSAKLNQLNVTKAASPPIQTDRFFRNGKHPDASAVNQMSEQLTQAFLFRSKECFSIIGDLGSTPGIQASSSAGSTKRWRFAFHTGGHSHSLLVRAVMYPPGSVGNFGNDTYSKLLIYSDATESTLVSTTELHYGPGPSNALVGGWQYHHIIDKFVTGLDNDTDYYAVVTDETYGRIQSMAVADLQSVTEKNSGYTPTNFTEQTPVLDIHRENMVDQLPLLWKSGGAKVFNWTTNVQSSPFQTTSATPTNILDGTSTTVTSSSAGYTLDMRYKTRLSQATVPCVLKVCASVSTGTLGRVYLKNSGGTVASFLNGWTSTPSWQSVTVQMPATLDKYDLHADDNGSAGTFSVYAACLYEYE